MRQGAVEFGVRASVPAGFVVGPPLNGLRSRDRSGFPGRRDATSA